MTNTYTDINEANNKINALQDQHESEKEGLLHWIKSKFGDPPSRETKLEQETEYDDKKDKDKDKEMKDEDKDKDKEMNAETNKKIEELTKSISQIADFCTSQKKTIESLEAKIEIIADRFKGDQNPQREITNVNNGQFQGNLRSQLDQHLQHQMSLEDDMDKQQYAIEYIRPLQHKIKKNIGTDIL